MTVANVQDVEQTAPILQELAQAELLPSEQVVVTSYRYFVDSGFSPA
jgi:hypothetical protein